MTLSQQLFTQRQGDDNRPPERDSAPLGLDLSLGFDLAELRYVSSRLLKVTPFLVFPRNVSCPTAQNIGAAPAQITSLRPVQASGASIEPPPAPPGPDLAGLRR